MTPNDSALREAAATAWKAYCASHGVESYPFAVYQTWAAGFTAAFNTRPQPAEAPREAGELRPMTDAPMDGTNVYLFKADGTKARAYYDQHYGDWIMGDGFHYAPGYAKGWLPVTPATPAPASSETGLREAVLEAMKQPTYFRKGEEEGWPSIEEMLDERRYDLKAGDEFEMLTGLYFPLKIRITKPYNEETMDRAEFVMESPLNAALASPADGRVGEMEAELAEAKALWENPQALAVNCLRRLSTAQIAHLFGDAMQAKLSKLERVAEAAKGCLEVAEAGMPLIVSNQLYNEMKAALAALSQPVEGGL